MQHGNYTKTDFIGSDKIAVMNKRRKKKFFRFTGEHAWIYDYQRRGFFPPHMLRTEESCR